jgi:hypothetical protein
MPSDGLFGFFGLAPANCEPGDRAADVSLVLASERP